MSAHRAAATGRFVKAATAKCHPVSTIDQTGLVMDVEIKFDHQGFEQDLRKAVDRAVNGLAREYQRMFESLGRRYQGQPVEVIKPVLYRKWSRLGGSLSDTELTEYAQHISDGRQITMYVTA